MSIIIVKNRTSNPIIELNLSASENKVIFYDKTFFQKDQTLVSDLIRLGSIEFIDENSDVIITKVNNVHKLDSILNSGMLSDAFLIFQTNYKDDDDYFNIVEKNISEEIIKILKVLFKKIKRSGGIPSYTIGNLFNAITATKFLDALMLGTFKQAGIEINSVATDAFFTINRKARLKEICDSVSL